MILKKTVDNTIEAMREYPERPKSLLEYNKLCAIDDELNEQNKEIYILENRLTNLEKELGETKGIFKGKQKRVLQQQIGNLKTEIEKQKVQLPNIVQKYGFKTVKEFYEKYMELQREKNTYEYKLSSWKEKHVLEKRTVSTVNRLRENKKGQNNKRIYRSIKAREER